MMMRICSPMSTTGTLSVVSYNMCGTIGVDSLHMKNAKPLFKPFHSL